VSTRSAVVESQLKSLLQLVEQQQAEECARIQANTRRQEREILDQAYRQARVRMHEAIVTERRRSARQLESTRARLKTRRRQHEHHLALLMLHRGWEALREALIACWRNPRSQRQWCDNILSRAQAVLPDGHWNIEHPSGWRRTPARKFSDKVEQATGQVPTLSPNSDLNAGLRVCVGTACVDGTLGEPGVGLLADRTRVEARLLAHLHHLLAKQQGNGH